MNNNYNNENNGVNNNSQMGYNPNDLNQTNNNLGTSTNQPNNYVNIGQNSNSPITNQDNSGLNTQQNLYNGVVNNSQVSNASVNPSQMVNNTTVQSNNINNNQYVNNNISSQVQQNTITNDKFCGKCGSKLSSTDVFCGGCGERVSNGQPQSTTRPLVDNFNSNINNNYNIGIVNDEELRRAYIGNKYSNFKDGGLSWLAFLFGPSYLIYRKMYLFGFLWFAANIIISCILPFLYIVQLGLKIFMLIKFKDLYLKHVDNKINKIKIENSNVSRNQLIDICAKKGGTSVGFLILTFVLLFVGIILVITPIVMGIIDDARNNNDLDDYGENNNYYEENNESNNNSSSNIITFKGFKFNKVSGYNYEEREGMLIITNNEYVMGINIVWMDYDYAKENIAVLKSQIEKNYDGQVSSGKIETYSGKSYIVFDVTSSIISGNEIITDAGNNLIFDCALYAIAF